MSMRERIVTWFVFLSLVSVLSTLAGFLYAVAPASSTATADASKDVGSVLREIISTGRLADLRWPDFSDYRDHIQKFYEFSDYSLGWVRDGQPTPQTLA